MYACGKSVKNTFTQCFSALSDENVSGKIGGKIHEQGTNQHTSSKHIKINSESSW